VLTLAACVAAVVVVAVFAGVVVVAAVVVVVGVGVVVVVVGVVVAGCGGVAVAADVEMDIDIDDVADVAAANVVVAAAAAGFLLKVSADNCWRVIRVFLDAVGVVEGAPLDAAEVVRVEELVVIQHVAAHFAEVSASVRFVVGAGEVKDLQTGHWAALVDSPHVALRNCSETMRRQREMTLPGTVRMRWQCPTDCP